jgi:hypothetical protein
MKLFIFKLCEQNLIKEKEKNSIDSIDFSFQTSFLVLLWMNRNQSVRITSIPRPRKYKRQLKVIRIVFVNRFFLFFFTVVEPFRNQSQDEYIRTQSQSTSSLVHIYPWTTLTHKDRIHRSKEFLSNSSPSFDVVERSVKYTLKLVIHRLLVSVL